jgi:AAA15 family ATPase/GTPase
MNHAAATDLMTLTRLAFKRYKAFAHDETVEIRPLTVLIGRNNSGT